MTDSKKLKLYNKVIIVLIIVSIFLAIKVVMTQKGTSSNFTNNNFVTMTHSSMIHNKPNATQRVRQMRGYNTQAYTTAKSLKEKMNVLNRAYTQGDIRSLRQINKLDCNNFTNLTLNVALYHEAKLSHSKEYAKQKDAAMEHVMIDMSNMPFKNRSVIKRYNMFSENIIREINQIVQAKDNEQTKKI